MNYLLCMEDKKRYRHQSYKRFKTSVDDWTCISLSAINLDVKEYDLTEEDVKEYIEFMNESQVRYKQFKRVCKV